MGSTPATVPLPPAYSVTTETRALARAWLVGLGEPWQVDETFASIDTNGDGFMDVAELAAAGVPAATARPHGASRAQRPARGVGEY